MSASYAPPAERFHLSMLIYDRRYRSLTIQVVALIAFLMAGGWLIRNLVLNFQELGQEFGFNFLFSESFYDLPIHLIEYSSTSSHMRAAFVGLLNTLLVAFLGCILATILGVIIGVLRLSNNWLVARLMTAYVEMFRNVPVLLWIIFVFALLTHTVLPHPREFQGEDATSSMLFGAIAMTKQGIWTPEILFSRGPGDIAIGNLFEVSIELICGIAVLIGSFIAARWNNTRADRIQAETGDRPNTTLANIAIWILPIVLLMWAFGFYLDGPVLQDKSPLRVFSGGTQIELTFIALWLALSLYTAAFIAEIVRGGILAISGGQTEAAHALGIKPSTTMRLVILPQALRVIIPPLISNYLNLTKNSSLAIAVGFTDITATLGGTTLNQTGRSMECLLLLMAFYLAISLTISAVINWYNERIKLKER